ncbi:hypothetical protein HRH25_16995 [Flavisolibacter sp. BT320]|nr:hypothetical protein [Flavisolibacter longurius]
MNMHILKVYFKAAVLVPFYLACFICFISISGVWIHSGYNWQAIAENSFCYNMLRVTFLSGITGLLTLTAFFNLREKVATSLFYSLLAWMLLPYLFITYLLFWVVDWSVMNRPGSAEMTQEIFLLVTCFFHTIGIIIGYTDFRATVILHKKEQAMNVSNTVDVYDTVQ